MRKVEANARREAKAPRPPDRLGADQVAMVEATRAAIRAIAKTKTKAMVRLPKKDVEAEVYLQGGHARRGVAVVSLEFTGVTDRQSIASVEMKTIEARKLVERLTRLIDLLEDKPASEG
jgi:hypothetical protein